MFNHFFVYSFKGFFSASLSGFPEVYKHHCEAWKCRSETVRFDKTIIEVFYFEYFFGGFHPLVYYGVIIWIKHPISIIFH